MKKSIKALSFLLSVILVLLSFSSLSFAAQEKDTALRFNDDGKFIILNFADIQDGYPMLKITKNLLRDTIRKVQPDLVVLTGDNIAGGRTTTKVVTRAAICEFMNIFEKEGVKVAAVFGNHDDESALASKEFQMSVYESYDCFVGCAGEDLPGCGTYNLPILSSDGEKYAFNLWMTDSLTYHPDQSVSHYECTSVEQINWYKAKSDELKEANGGNVVPSINFQHIIVPEIFDALVECDSSTEGSVSYKGKFYRLPDGNDGVLHEHPCPPDFTNGQFDAFVEKGDVIATVSGHDHVNDFIVPHMGVDIINTPGAGFRSYNDETVGARVFVLDENDPWNYETYVEGYFDVYGDSATALYLYQMNSRTTDTMTKFLAFFKYILSVFTAAC